MSDWNDRVIAQFRANGGEVEGFARGLVLLHTTGARSGEARVSPVAAITEGGAWLVVGSKAGAPTNPAWYHNLVADPDVSIETPSGSLDVHAVELTDDDEYEAVYARFVARSPQFAEYRERAQGRHIPILRLEPRG